jgi:hypothetical protein
MSAWYMDLCQFLYTILKIEIQAFCFFIYLNRTAVITPKKVRGKAWGGTRGRAAYTAAAFPSVTRQWGGNSFFPTI